MSLIIKSICQVPVYQTLFKTMKKYYMHQAQTDFQQQCRYNNVIPKGIADQCNFTLSYSNPDLQVLINSMFHFSKSRAFDIIIMDYQLTSKKLKNSLYSQINRLKTSNGPEFLEVLETLNSYFVPIITSLKVTHYKKLLAIKKSSNTMYYSVNQSFDITSAPPKKKNNRKFKRTRCQRPTRLNKKQVTNNLIKGTDGVKINDQMILNLSDKILTNEQKEVLTLGPNFAITPPNICIAKRDDDIDKWTNKLRWGHFFSKNPPKQQCNNPHKEAEIALIPPSGKSAPKSTSLALELYLSLTVKDLKVFGSSSNSYDNITPQHRQSLKQLQSWEDVTIRFFDKGTGWVIDNNRNYENKVLDHLNDPSTFHPINTPEDVTPIPREIASINQIFFEWTEIYLTSEDISSKIAQWVIKDSSRPGYNYVNYKVHKPEANFLGRLITSGCGSPTERLAEFSEFYLHPIASSLQYALKDTSDFLYHIDSFNSDYEGDFDDIILATWDIVAMFPSIDNKMGLKACEDLLNERVHQFPSTKCIVDATRLTLENNLSIFNNVAYLQTNGTAMGPHNACSYADIAMHPIDVTINSCTRFKLPLWVRFKDDIFCPWSMGESHLHEFTEWINTINPRIKYKLSYSRDSIEYLDTKVYIKDGQIHTTLYSKPSDTHDYLHPSSCHPKHICKNIANGVGSRIRRICSEQSEYEKHKNIQTKHFADRGYNLKFISDKFSIYDNIDRQDLIRDPEISFNLDQNSGSGRRFPLVLDFHPSFANASKVLNRHKDLLDLDPELVGLIDKNKIFATFRKAKTLGDLLVSFRYPITTKIAPNRGCFSCKKCILCKYYIYETISIQSMTTSKHYQINCNISCNDTHVIYVITDRVCGKQSVGSTEGTMRSRFSNHKSHIKNKVRTCRVAVHFNDEPKHCFNIDKIDATLALELHVTLIDKVMPDPWDTKESMYGKLCNKESYWQNQLNSFTWAGGLNTRNERTIANKKSIKPMEPIG